MNRFVQSLLSLSIRRCHQVIKFVAITLGSLALVVSMGAHQPALSQSSSFDRDAKQIYPQLPELPLGNNFIFAPTNQPLENNTLLSRLLRYHRGKLRNPESRFDWKLTLADYLGVNETINPDRYPGSSQLTVNPFPQDQAMVDQLNRVEREALITAIVSYYRPAPPIIDDSKNNNDSDGGTSEEILDNDSSAEIVIPRPGDASLLGF